MVRIVVSVFLLLPVFLFASTTQSINEEVGTELFEIAAKIYLVDGVQVVGEESIYNAEIVVKNNFTSKAHIQLSNQSAQKEEAIVSHKKSHKAKDSNKKKIIAKNQLKLYKISDVNTDFCTVLEKDIRAVISTRSFSQKFTIAERFETEIVEITSQLKKQKFYTSLSYLQFRKYSSSSLRGPPRNI